MTKNEGFCAMESRIVKLEAKQESLENVIESYADALKENTKSINELCKTMIRHDEMLKENEKEFATHEAVITGVVVGVVILLVDGLVHLI